ncbi:MAG: hypothetical protein WBH76_01400 [Dictyoglomaceae bacterium]
MVDFVELEKQLLEKNQEYENIVDEYKTAVISAIEKRNEAKKQYALKYLELRAEQDGNGKKKLTEEEARQRAYLETYDYQVEADIAKVTADTLYEKLEQIKYEIDSLRSILSAYKETYERVTVL